MVYEIDQSGKIEDTNVNTVISMSNGNSFSVMIKASEKRRLKQYFRGRGKMSRYPYYILAYCIAKILYITNVYSRVVVDTEYIGHDVTIKMEVEGILLFMSDKKVSRRNIQFGFVGKRSSSHKLALSVGRGFLKPQKVIKYEEIVRSIEK